MSASKIQHEDCDDLQETFETIWLEIYPFLKERVQKPPRISWKSEILWIVNAHGHNLSALAWGYKNSDTVHQKILEYTLRLWNSIKEKISSKKIYSLFNQYEKKYVEIFADPDLPDTLFAIAPICPTILGQAYFFSKMTDTLAKELQRLQEYLQKNSFYDTCHPGKELKTKSEQFQEDLKKIQSQIIDASSQEALLPQHCLGIYLSHIFDLYQNALLLFPWLSDNALYKLIFQLSQTIENHYPIQSELPYQDALTIQMIQSPLFPESFIEKISCTKVFFPKDWKPIGIQPWVWKFQSKVWTAPERESLKKIAEWYKQTAQPLIYKHILEKFSNVKHDVYSLSQYFSYNSSLELAQEVFQYLKKHQDQERWEEFQPFLSAYGIEVITQSNAQEYVEDDELLVHEYSFGLPKSDSLTQPGIRFMDQKFQIGKYVHVIGKEPYCVGVFARLKLFAQKNLKDFPDSLKEKLESIIQPEFWYLADSKRSFSEKKLYPAVVQIIQAMDAFFYKDLFLFSKKVRIQYECLLLELQRAIQQDGWKIGIAAGKFLTIQQIQSLPSWSRKWELEKKQTGILLKREHKEYVTLGFPYPQEGFCRYIVSENSSTPGFMVYTRAWEPEIMKSWQTFFPTLDQEKSAIPSQCFALLNEHWHIHPEKAKEALIFCLNSLIPHISLETREKINQALIKDHFPILLPSLEIIGKKWPLLDPQESVFQDRIEYRFCEDQEKDTILEILSFGFEKKQVKIAASLGKCDEALCLSWEILGFFSFLLKRFSFLQENQQNPLASWQNQPFYSLKKLSLAWPGIIKNIMPLSPEEYHALFILQNGRTLTEKYKKLLDLLCLADMLVSLFYPDTLEYQELCDRVAEFLQKQNLKIQPISLLQTQGNSQIRYILWTENKILSIVQRRILHRNNQAILLYGNCASSSDYCLDALSPFTPGIKKLFLFFWASLQRIGTQHVREQALEKWQAVYYQIQAQPKISFIIELVNLAYKYQELLTPFMDFPLWQHLLEPALQLLSAQGYKVLDVQIGQPYQATDSLYYDKEESLLQHAQAENTILAIAKPCILKKDAHDSWQKGKVFVAK
ncbi:MAG: hypothetical protein HUU50_04075 [Candidatus Brocadiae bacterium]|nr:hypothetical protein [Candidatus Brocadiia bacterium]